MKKYPSLYFNVQDFSKLFEMKTGVAVHFKPPGLTAFQSADANKVQQATALAEEASKLFFPHNVERLFGPPVVWATKPQNVNQAFTILSRYNPRPNGHHFMRFNTNQRSGMGVLSWSSNPDALRLKIARWEELLRDVDGGGMRNPTARAKPDVNPLSHWLDLKEFELHNSSLVRQDGKEWLVWAETQGVADLAAQKLATQPLPLLAEPKLVRLASANAQALQAVQQAVNKLIKPEDTVVNWASAEQAVAGEEELVLRSRLPQVGTVLDKINAQLEDSFAELIQVPAATQQQVDAAASSAGKLALLTLTVEGAAAPSTVVLSQASSRRAMQAARDLVLGLQHTRIPAAAATAATPAAAAATPVVGSEVRSLAPKLDLTKKKPAPAAKPTIDLTKPMPQSPPQQQLPVLDLTKTQQPQQVQQPAPKQKTVLSPKQQQQKQQQQQAASGKAASPVSISVQPGTATTIVQEMDPIKLASVGPISFVTTEEDASLTPSKAAVRQLAPTMDFTKVAAAAKSQQRPVLNLLATSTSTSAEEPSSLKERPRLDLSGGGSPARRPFRAAGQFSAKLDIPTEYVGKMIGRGGSGMREIESQTNARVKFQDEQDISVCTISAHTEQDLRSAEDYIRAKLVQFESDDADYSAKRTTAGQPGQPSPRRRGSADEFDPLGGGGDDDDDDFVRGDSMEDADGFIDHQAPIVDPEFMKIVWNRHKEDPRAWTNAALAVEFNISREDLDPIMTLMRYREAYIKRNQEDEQLMDDSYEKLNAEHMGVYRPEHVSFDQIPRPFLTPKFRFVAYNSQLGCKNYYFATNSEEIASYRDDYVYLPGVHLHSKPKPQKIQDKTTTVDGWLINKVTADNRNLRNLHIAEWNQAGRERRLKQRIANNDALLVREGLIQVGHGKFSRVGHYTSSLAEALQAKV